MPKYREVEYPTQLDITAPEMVQVEWDQARKVLYVHVDGYTTLRICRIENIEFQGLRQPLDECLKCGAKLWTTDEKSNHFVGGKCQYGATR